MKVFLLGRDGVGWSIDRDREYTARALEASGHRLVRNPVTADVVYCVWWNMLDWPRYRPLRFKRLVAVVTNDLAHQEDLFERIRPRVNVWVVANGGQAGFLAAHGITEDAIRHSPFYVDEQLFRPAAGTREELARAAGVDPDLVRDRFLIGSFQRDSLGADLTQPKWQKDPELLLAILERLPSEAVLLVLAGPRRHFVVGECRRRSIPYLFVGQEPDPDSPRDDIADNTLGSERIAALWNLIDLYVVPSKSEGGPKAVFEAALSETPIVSTPVGIAADVLPDSLVFHDADEGAQLVRAWMGGRPPPDFAEFVEKAHELNSFEAFRRRVDGAVRAAASANARRSARLRR